MCKEEKTSEFGKGFAYSLVLFAKHFENDMAVKARKLDHYISNPEKAQIDPDTEIAIQIWGKDAKAVSRLIELWANGATDHLYELEIPPEWRRKKIGKLVKKLKDKGLAVGHGFTGNVWTIKDFYELQTLTMEIAFELDKLLGVKPIEAEWK